MTSIVIVTWHNPGACEATRETHILRRAHFLDHLMPMRELAGLPHEVIVVSNGVASYTEELRGNPHIDKLIANDPPLGVVWSRRDGADAASGSHILILDDDFEFTPDWLVSMMDLHNEFPDRLVCGFKWPLCKPEERTDRWMRITYVNDNCMLVSRELFDKLGALKNCCPSRYKGFWRECRKHASTVGYIPIPEPLIHWGGKHSTFFDANNKCVWRGQVYDPKIPESGIYPAAGER